MPHGSLLTDILIREPWLKFLWMIGFAILLVSYGLTVSSWLHVANLLSQYLPWVGAAFGIAIMLYCQMLMLYRRIRHRQDGPSFLEIDRLANRSPPSDRMEDVVAEIRRLSSVVTTDRDDFEALITKIQSSVSDSARASLPAETFQAQMALTSRVLEDKAKLADEKASALLDRGVVYTKFGIGFFITSIVVWQVLAWWRGFQTQLIFGISSSAVLFVFVQFLSSWFLKQYRHFVEVSTYLIEIKSVFDRYALLHHLVREVASKEGAKDDTLMALVGALKEEMKWPRARPGFTQDVYYAKDALGATEELVKLIRTGNGPNRGLGWRSRRGS